MSERLARFRVPLGWTLGLVLLYLSRPTLSLLVLGALVAAAGEAMRLWASGHLEKDRRLTTSGPYAWTRNPLYLGSFVVGIGFCIASGRPSFLLLLAVLFGAVYVPVMKREAVRLEAAHPEGYPGYSDRVPLFLPWRGKAGADGTKFSWSRVVDNREHQTLLGLLAVVLILLGKLSL